MRSKTEMLLRFNTIHNEMLRMNETYVDFYANRFLKEFMTFQFPNPFN